MMKTCVVCGRIHDINKICKRVTKQKATPGTKFRKSYGWTEKSKGIRARDKHLCQVCITGKYNTNYRYTYKELEVHHIVPIEEDYSKRLDETNLITLCRYHHELAEKNTIVLKQSNPVALEIPEIWEDLVKKRAKAIAVESVRENFLTKHCNIIYQGMGTESYIDVNEVMSCKVAKIDWTGRKVYIGVDLAMTNDNCAVAKMSKFLETSKNEKSP